MKTSFIVLIACILIKCVLGGNVTLAVNQVPQWDLCVLGGDIFSCSGHGMCSGPGGQCVCTGGYTGRDCSIPPGGSFPYSTPLAAVTQFCQLETGGCAPGMCIGGGSFDNTNLPAGVDGVAAVNPTLYGSRYAYAHIQGGGSPQTLSGQYSFIGQSCGTCWKLTRGTVSIVVTVVDRCAGYCRATPGANQQCSSSAASGAKECGECIQVNEPSIPQCSCLSANSTNNHGWCNGYPTAHCDWCAANDHPHFDLDITSQMKICGAQGSDGFCYLDSFQMVACPALKGEWPNGLPGAAAPATAAPSSSGSAASSSGSSSSGSGSQQGSAAGACPIVNDKGVCSTLNSGAYMCNGCNLTMCSFGQLYNLGCPAGTSCSNGACTFSTTCDPKVSISSACASSSSAATPAPTQASTPAQTAAPTSAVAPPPVGATTRPTPTPTVTPAPTQAVVTPAPTPAATAAAPAPANTPAPTAASSHPCQARRKRMAEEMRAAVKLENEESLPAVAEAVELVQPVAEITPSHSSASLLVASSIATLIVFVLYL